MQYVTGAIAVDSCVSFDAIRRVKFQRLQSLDFEQFEEGDHIRYHHMLIDDFSSRYHGLE